jgi:hypothetical protein
MYLAHDPGLLHRSETTVAEAFRQVGDAHRDKPGVFLNRRRRAGR